MIILYQNYITLINLELNQSHYSNKVLYFYLNLAYKHFLLIFPIMYFIIYNLMEYLN